MAETRQHSAPGPVGRQVAQNLASARATRRATTSGLAQAITSMGIPMTASTITKIETQGRRVTVDELIAFAVALEVSPVTLLLPANKSEPLPLAPRLESVSWRGTWGWMHGRQSLAIPTEIAAGTRSSTGHLPWLADNQPYLDEDELSNVRFAQPSVPVELVPEEGGDNGPGS